MIVFDLVCAGEHRFEGWFSSGADFASQNERRLVQCPSCGSAEVRRVPSPARINLGAPAPVAASPAEASVANGTEGKDPFAIAQMLYSRMLDELLTKSEDVGKAFPAEARRIFYKEAEARPIRGEATLSEHQDLVEEGIPVLRLPVPPADKLN
jgi:hypothetical protein